MVGVETEGVDHVRNEWARLFEPFKPRVEQWQSPNNAWQDPKPEYERIRRKWIKLIAERIQPAEHFPEKHQRPEDG